MENESIPPITERQSAAFYALKGLAIIPVVCAHCTNGAGGGDLAALLFKLRSIVGTLGVPCFFFASGYFYKRLSGDALNFWRKKIPTIFVPWLVAAILTFAYWTLKDRNFADLLVRFVKWFLGIGSWFYFMTALICCFAWFKMAKDRFDLWTTMALTIGSMVATRLGYIPKGEWFTEYVNPFNWLGFFALGIWARRYAEKRLFEQKRPVWFALGLFALIAGVRARFYYNDFADAEGNPIVGYFSFFALPIELGALVVALGLANLLRKSRFFVDLGKKSFAVYFYHMPIVGIVCALFKRFEGPATPVLVVAAPLVAVLVAYLALLLLEFVAKKLRLTPALTLLGLR